MKIDISEAGHSAAFHSKPFTLPGEKRAPD